MDDDRVGAKIFQTWKTKHSLPESYAYWRSTIVRKNPDFTHVLWDDADNRAFIADLFPWFLPTYDSFPAEIYRADCIRYFYLYVNGGLYIDLDTECLAPLRKYTDYPGVLLGRMGPYPEFTHAIPNAIMGSRPREEFWLLMIGLIEQLCALGFNDRGPEYLTGPVALKSAVDIYSSKEPLFSEQIIRSVTARLPASLRPRSSRTTIFMLRQREWYPLDWTDAIHVSLRQQLHAGLRLSEEQMKGMFPEASLVTYWSHSWEDEAKPGR